MGRIIGIDLGTTYSVAAIAEERAADGFLTVKGCPGCSVILDPLKRRITPSVVAENAAGKLIVGYAAKACAGLSPEPIMFAKRWMGEDKTFALGKQGTLTPVEVSAHVLRYLKEVAEKRLGEPVDEAVITVPAYFSLKAKQMTEKAAELAGLRVARIAQEPVAAALMYFAGDARDPLRILTYDLGGGTFDVAVVEKRDGVLSTDSILAFDGDRFLGGYDFDKLLAFWLQDRLVEQGYDLRLDLKQPADREAFAKLMVLAERAKVALSAAEVFQVLDQNSGITDHAGNPVAVDLEVTREAFEGMILAQVEYTLAICRRALAKVPVERQRAGGGPGEVDEIILVGGSSRIPLVQQRLEAEFGRKPRLVEPDLCVALGAAILARLEGPSAGCLKLKHVPAETDQPSIVVSGRVQAGGPLPAVQGCKVHLRAADGSYQKSVAVPADGNFLFLDVPLAEEQRNDFTVAVTGPAGQEAARLPLTVTHRTAAGAAGPGLMEGGGVTNVLAKAISIREKDGLHVIAPERTPLPYTGLVGAETTDTSGVIRVPICEDNAPLGEIRMSDVPPTLAVGSTVNVTLTIQENYQIVGRANVPSLGREATVVIDIPVPPRKTIDELREEFEELAARAENALAGASRAALMKDGQGMRLKEALERGRELLQGRDPEAGQIADCLAEIDGLVRALARGWKPEPPWKVFEVKCSEAEDLLKAAAERDPKVTQDGYDKELAAIGKEGKDAYGAQDPAKWKDANVRLVGLCDRLERLGEKKGPKPPPPKPGAILFQLGQMLSALEDQARSVGRHDEFAEDFKHLAAELKAIKPDAADFDLAVRDWCGKFEDLKRQVLSPKQAREEGVIKVQQPGAGKR